MSKSYVFRCPTCKTKCPRTVEDKTRTPSYCVLVESNKFTRKAPKNDLDSKIRAWGNSSAPAHFSSSSYAISLETLEKIKFLKRGALNQGEDQETVSLKIREDDGTIKSSDEESFDGTTSDAAI